MKATIIAAEPKRSRKTYPYVGKSLRRTVLFVKPGYGLVLDGGDPGQVGKFESEWNESAFRELAGAEVVLKF